MAVVTLDAGDEIVAESGSMVAMSEDLSVKTTFNGMGEGGAVDVLQAVITGLVRKFFAGETMFVNRFTGRRAGQQVMLAPPLSGDVEHVRIEKGRSITVQSMSYLASTRGVIADLIWGGFSMLFSREGAFFLRCRGEGELLLNAYGAIEKVPVDGAYVVDSGHVVAFEGDLNYRIRRAGGWKTTILSGEGLVLEFTGTGVVWLQTRNLGQLVRWIRPALPR
jgi:uncharacterized protein (TIGR00266 family)